MSSTRELLRRVAAHDERCLQTLLVPGTPDREAPPRAGSLPRGTRALVELAALLAADAPTPSVRLAVDRAATNGADDAALVQVLWIAAGAAGTAQAVKSAARLALALDLDIERGLSPGDRPRSLGPRPRSATRRRAFDTRRVPAS